MLWSLIDSTLGFAGEKESESTRRIGPLCPVWDSIKSLVTTPFRAPRFTPCDSHRLCKLETQAGRLCYVEQASRLSHVP